MGRCSVVTGTAVRRPPPKGVYPCAGDDEWVAIAVASDEQWRSLRSLLGDPSWMQSDDLSTRSAGALRTSTSTENCPRGPDERSAEECMQMLLDVGIPCGRSGSAA